MRALITGVNGFSGRCLCGHLWKCNYEVYGIGRQSGGPGELVNYFQGDLTDSQFCKDVVRTCAPDIIFHLAMDFDVDDLVCRTTQSFQNISNAVGQMPRDPSRKILVVGSAAEVGVPPSVLPVSEDVVCSPTTIYGHAKHKVTNLAMEVTHTQVIVARTFNLIGPGLPARFSVGNFVKQIQQVVSGRKQFVETGPLDTHRDFIDVRDAVRFYERLASSAPGGVYNVCSGEAKAISDIVTQLFQLAGLCHTVLRSARIKLPAGVPLICGDNSRLLHATGASLHYTLKRSLSDMLARR